MMTPRENFMAIYEMKQPDCYADIRESMALIVNDPILKADRIPNDGKQHQDSWGTTCVWLPGAPGKHPYVTEENAVIKDVTKWKEQIKIPPVTGLDWSEAEAAAAQVDRSQKFVYYFSTAGLFERAHFLMGMENALCAYLEEPEAMEELLRAIADFKIAAIKEAAVHIHPDVVFFQDDWGTKQNLFLPPRTWRELIEPLQKEIAQTIHDCGALYFHHADCVCEPIVEDMVDVGIDLWQGVIPQNDIVEIQKRTNHQLAIAGGIDSPAIDGEEITDDEVRAEVHRCIDTYCPGGRFFPQATPLPFNDRCRKAMLDELKEYGREWALEHPRR